MFGFSSDNSAAEQLGTAVPLWTLYMPSLPRFTHTSYDKNSASMIRLWDRSYWPDIIWFFLRKRH